MKDDYTDFVSLIQKKTGIDLSLYKEAQMKRRLTSLRDKKGFSDFQSFFQAMLQDHSLFEQFLDRMTINVSEFFRNYKRWEVLEKKIIPELLKGKRKLKVWSAACSTGEEPYTLVMLLSKFMPLSDISVLATDLDEGAIARAKKGVYPERSLQEVPDPFRKEFFKNEGTLFMIDEKVKNRVTFRKHNLLADQFEDQFDLIVCRNVLIYFTEDAKHTLYQKFSDALRPGGILFVGSTEQIFNPLEYRFLSEETFFYKKI